MFCSYKVDGSYSCGTNIIENFASNLKTGQICTHNTECISQACGGVCQKGSANKPCQTNNDCISNMCNNQNKCAKGGYRAVCRQHSDCANNKKCEMSICSNKNL